MLAGLGSGYNDFLMGVIRNAAIDQIKERLIELRLEEIALVARYHEDELPLVAEIFFDNVRVPRANLLGPENDGWKVTITTLMNERVAIGGLGVGEDALTQLVDLARRVRRHGQ